MNTAKELLKIARGLVSFEVLVPDMSQTTRLGGTIKKKLNKALVPVLKPTYFEKIPLNDIFEVIKGYGVDPIDEDGTPWSGMLVGQNSRVHIDLAFDGKLVKDCALQLSWYKMPSGRYEITCYIM